MSTTPRRTIRVSLRVLGESVAVEAAQPEGYVRLDEVLPFLRTLEDRVIDVAIRQSEINGAKISCRDGCAACCKAQPVPVTPPEALALLRLAEALPEPRRTEVRQRFAVGAARLRAAGLADQFLHRDEKITNEAARAIAERYFGLRLVCPFLENDSCSIYADRPFVCRQYLVTSPAELCSDPFHNPVKPLRMPIAAAGATLEIAEKTLGKTQYTVPLILALEYAQSARPELERTFSAPELVEKWVQALAQASKPVS